MMRENENKIKFVYHDLQGELATESVWALKQGEYYQIKNIPFFAPNIAFDDIVSVEDDEGELFFDNVIKESGNSTVQIIIFSEKDIKEITKKIECYGCGWEGSHIKTYISVNIPSEIGYSAFKNFLQDQSDKGVLDYKEACLAHQK